MTEEMKQCPYCGEEILAVARKCKHCGEWLDKEDKKETVEVKNINCPICGEEILSNVEVCPYCNEKVASSESGQCKDPLLNIKLQPTWALVLACFLISFYGTQLAWFIFGNIFGSRKIGSELRGFRMCNLINSLTEYESNKISDKLLFPLFGITIIAAALYTINLFENCLPAGVVNFIGLVFLAVYITCGVITLKYVKIIEEHIRKSYNLRIEFNKFGAFMLQAFYLNYFLNSYKDRIDEAKKYRRN